LAEYRHPRLFVSLNLITNRQIRVAIGKNVNFMNVYHYTNLEALNGILNGQQQRECSLNFWGTRYDSLNDSQDYIFAKNVVLPKILKAIEKEECLNEEKKEINHIFPYIVSFSENKDDEFMWQHYNAEVCIVVDSTYFSPWIIEEGVIKGFWGKCDYVNENNIDKSFFQKWKSSIQHIENISSMAQHACVFLKREAFKKENEWRLYLGDEINIKGYADGNIEEVETPQDIKVKCIRNKDFILYKEFKINYKALKGIIINDVNIEHYRSVKKHLEILLLSRGFDLSKILIEQTNRYPLN